MSIAKAFRQARDGLPDSLTFRDQQLADMAFLAELYASTRAQELAPVPWPEEQKRAFLQQQFEAQHQHYQTHYPNADYLMILDDQQPAGRVYVDRRDDEIRLVDIALSPAFRGAGLGTKLLHLLMHEATAREQPLRIHVEKNNPAMRLYKRLGFKPIEDKGVYDLMEFRR